jgi:hypothetical protein
MSNYSLETIDKELEEIESALEEYRALIQRRATLQQLRAIIAKLENKEPTIAALPLPVVPVNGNSKQALDSHADYVREALRKSGPLTMSELLEAVRELGWKGSGDDAKDKARLNNPLYRGKGTHFQLRHGKWSLI